MASFRRLANAAVPLPVMDITGLERPMVTRSVIENNDQILELGKRFSTPRSRKPSQIRIAPVVIEANPISQAIVTTPAHQ